MNELRDCCAYCSSKFMSDGGGGAGGEFAIPFVIKGYVLVSAFSQPYPRRPEVEGDMAGFL